MTIPATPLPGIVPLLQVIGASTSTGEHWYPQGNGKHSTQVYRRGSYALAAGVEAVRSATGSERVIVWFPAYFCNEALDPLRQMPVTFRFYRVLPDLTPDWSDVGSQEGEPDSANVFVLVHYFGFPNATREARDFCDENGMVLLEDAAHVLRPSREVGLGDLLVFSPRKLLAVPSGGVLVVLGRWVSDLEEASSSNVGADETFRWLAKRLAQQVFIQLGLPWHRFRPNENPHVQNGDIEYPTRPALERCNSFDLKLLTVMEQDFDRVAERRRSNYQRLLDWTDQLSGAKPLFDQLSSDVCPYAFPLLVEEGTADVVAWLNTQGIPASRWPDLPPEVLDEASEHNTSIATFERLMLLPVHQSLSTKQIDLVGEKLRLALSGQWREIAERI